MSGVLDQFLLEEIAKFCPEPFLEYHKCMMKNPADTSECVPVQKALSSCIRSEVPAFQRIQTDCVQHLKNYESCLRTNINDRPTTKCFDVLQDLRKCASSTMDKK